MVTTTRKQGHTWTPAQIEYLMKHRSTPNPVIANNLGLTIKQVDNKRRQLLQQEAKRNEMKESDLQRFIGSLKPDVVDYIKYHYITKKEKAIDVANALKVKTEFVMKVANLIRQRPEILTKHRPSTNLPANSPFKPVDVQRLETVKKELEKPEKRAPRPPVGTEHDEFIRDNWRDLSPDRMAKELKISRTTVRRRMLALQLGLEPKMVIHTPEPKVETTHLMKNNWGKSLVGDRYDAYIRTNYSRQTIAEMAKSLGASRNTIGLRIKELGMKSPWLKGRRKTPAEIMAANPPIPVVVTPEPEPKVEAPTPPIVVVKTRKEGSGRIKVRSSPRVVAYLTENYRKQTPIEMGKTLNLAEITIKKQLSEMGLKALTKSEQKYGEYVNTEVVNDLEEAKLRVQPIIDSVPEPEPSKELTSPDGKIKMTITIEGDEAAVQELMNKFNNLKNEPKKSLWQRFWDKL